MKSVEFVSQAGELVAYKLLPNLKLLGKKLGKLVPAVRDALAEADAAALVAKIEAGESITIQLPGSSELPGSSVELQPEDVLCNRTGRRLASTPITD